MSKEIVKNQWSDEACQYWLDKVGEEMEQCDIHGSEADNYFWPMMPDPVREYLMRQTTEKLNAGFEEMTKRLPGVIADTVEVVVSVDSID